MQKPADEIFPHIARMSSDQNIQRFKHAYLVCTRILSVFCLLSIPGALFADETGHPGYVAGVLMIGILPWIPVFLPRGLLGNLRFALVVSVMLSVIFGIWLGFIFIEFVRTGGGEGPNGEGSPLATIIAMTIFGAVFFCPWLLTALRGRPLWRNHPPES